tara:strand:- start:2716 stop:2976 length:261 start_codon:yes stop_codon:yes gene_type:complete
MKEIVGRVKPPKFCEIKTKPPTQMCNKVAFAQVVGYPHEEGSLGITGEDNTSIKIVADYVCFIHLQTYRGRDDVMIVPIGREEILV